MRKYLYFMLACIFPISCNKNTQKSEGNQPVYDYELVKTDKILSYDLDDNTKYQFTALFPYTDKNGKEYLTFKNSLDEILFYELESGNFLFKIKIDREGPNGVLGVSGYYVEDFNNIYLTSVLLRCITKVDTSGVVIQKIDYKTTDTGYEVRPTFISYSCIYTPLVIVDGKLYITQKPSGMTKVVSQTPVSIEIDTVNQVFTGLPIDYHYQGIIKEEDIFNVSFFVSAFSREFNGKEFIYSFYYDENIQVASLDHKNIRNFPAKSKYIDKLTIEKKPDDFVQMVKKDMEMPYFGNLLYDKYQDVYYRLAFPEVELDNDLDYKNLASYGRTKFSIVILDKDFNIIGETLFPEFIYCSSILFVHKDGLFICNGHPKNPAFNEDVLSFQCFELIKKTNELDII